MSAPKAAFMVIYRWRLKPGMEGQFIGAWSSVTRLLRQHAGGLGSRLHRTHDGHYLAYAMWPSEEVRSAAASFLTPERLQLRDRMREAVAEEFPEVRLAPVVDLLTPADVEPPAPGAG